MPERTRKRTALRAAMAALAGSAVVAGLVALPTDGGDAARTHLQEAPASGTATMVSDGVAQTEQQAKTEAKGSGKQVEVVALRDERRDVFAEPNGTFTAREYTEPVRTVRNGAWVAVDKTLVRRADGSWAPEASTVGLEISGGGKDEPFVRMMRAGRQLALTWPYGKLGTPVVDGDTATYAEVLPGVDLTVRAETDGFGHLLVVKTPEAAANPKLATLQLGMRADGLKMTESASGALTAEDAQAGGTVFEAGRPVMWDSAAVKEAKAAPAAGASKLKGSAPSDGAPADKAALRAPGGGGKATPFGIEMTQDKLTLVPDQKMLRDPATVFPVVIDPIQRTTSRTAWSGVMSGMRNEQDWKYSGSAGVGKCPTDYSAASCAGIGVRRTLYTVPLSFYKNKQILSATFSARVHHIYSASPTAEPIQLYRIGGKNREIVEGSDWASTEDEWSSHLETVDAAISPSSCDAQPNLNFKSGATGGLTNQVRSAVEDGWTRISFGLKAGNENTFPGWKRVCGNVFLSVSYNTLPKQISTRDMTSNPGGACTWGTGRPYADEPPQLSTEARDPDHGGAVTDKVKVQFAVEWDGGGYTYDTPYKSPIKGTRFTHTVHSDIPENKTIYWKARAYDGDGWGPWSNIGDTPQRCEFVYDSTFPGKPLVNSKQYPSNNVYSDGVGTYGTFTFAPNPNDKIVDTDVVKYEYSFSDGTKGEFKPTSGGGQGQVTWMPTSPGRHWLEVVAVDRAEHPSSKHHYSFLVSEGRPVAGQWNLGDAVGSTAAHDERGNNSADAGTGVVFGVEGPGGKADSAARFDGTSTSFLDAGDTLVDTTRGFSVSAWVRPTALDRDMTVVTQDGTGEPGFTLGYDAIAKTWAFSAPVSDVDSLGAWKAVATGVVPVKDQWVLLTGVYDPKATGGPLMQLYVNKDLKGTVIRQSSWISHGHLQIGRSASKSGYDRGEKGGYRNFFTGDLAEVRVFDRVVVAAQVAELMTVKPQRAGYWQLDEATGGSSPETGGGQPLTLSGGPQIYRPADPLFDDPALVGGGHLVLDGINDYASTATPPVTGAGSFTVSARVRMPSLDPTKAQTVLSLPGATANRFKVRYKPSAEGGNWELEVAKSDSAAAAVVSVIDDEELPDANTGGQHLAVVYDAFANELRLYVDGQFAQSARVVDTTLWPATGGLQVGRAARGSAEYFSGAVDEVRVYKGAADLTAIQQFANPMALPDR
ncbi:LamG domain-containing protein [Streptomyces sp. NPDC056883]|uniref:LamG domain-containing protein n=1 Tax=Streptomyces sp. NPDC056883 TaxID=3345959 RepID=UPI00369CDCFF